MWLPRALEELQKQCPWVGLTMEGFLEEESQDPGDGEGMRVGACGSHTLWLCLFQGEV